MLTKLHGLGLVLFSLGLGLEGIGLVNFTELSPSSKLLSRNRQADRHQQLHHRALCSHTVRTDRRLDPRCS